MNSWNVLTEATTRGVNLMTRPELLSLGGPHPGNRSFHAGRVGPWGNRVQEGTVLYHP